MVDSLFTIHHASLIVSNTQTSLKFYCDVLGMEQTERPDLGFPGAWLQIGAQQIHLLELPNPDPTTGRPEHGGRDRHVALMVAQLEPIKDRLDKHNVAYTLSISGRRAFFCRDFDGNAIEIIERP
ncbi:MAG: VOC family protein [Methylococcales bacterium]|nr:VOC family protein [Methylococcales bacterium]